MPCEVSPWSRWHCSATLARSEVVIEGARYETSAVLRVWLGETPADAGLKKGMLGAG